MWRRGPPLRRRFIVFGGVPPQTPPAVSRKQRTPLHVSKRWVSEDFEYIEMGAPIRCAERELSFKLCSSCNVKLREEALGIRQLQPCLKYFFAALRLRMLTREVYLNAVKLGETEIQNFVAIEFSVQNWVYFFSSANSTGTECSFFGVR